MSYCRNCGAKLPEDAVFCSNCGVRTEVRAQPTPEIGETVTRYLVVGLIGAFLSVMITSFSGTAGANLYFLPSFASSILIIYIYRVREFRGALITALTVYLFSDGILGTIILGGFFATHGEYVFVPELVDVLLYPFNSISAFVAAYVGVRLGPKREREPILVPQKTEEGPGGVIYSL